MRNVPLKGFLKKSPMKNVDTTKDVDTTLVDQVYTKERVDTDLRKRGLHTVEGLRGTKDTTPTEGTNVSKDIQPINPDAEL